VPLAFHARRARYRSLLGEHEGAAADRRQARLGPQTALDHFLAGLQAWQKGEADRALADCDEALRQRPDHFWAQYVQALCHCKKKSWSEARVALTGCLAQRPDFLWARLLRASAHAEVGDLDAAEKDFAQALAQAEDGRDGLARYLTLVNRTALRLRQNRLADALRDLGRAAAARNAPHEAYVSMARVYEQRQDWNAAAEALGRALAFRLSAVLYHERARAHRKRGDLKSARADLDRAIGLEPAGSRSEVLARALVDRADLQSEAGDHDAALADCTRALQCKPHDEAALRRRTDLLLALGRAREAGEALDEYLAAIPGPFAAGVYVARGTIHSYLGEHEAAISCYGAALQQGPDPVAHERRGWTYLRKNAVELALADFEAAWRGGRKTAQVLCGRALVRVRVRQLEEAVQDAEAAVRLSQRSDAEAPLLAACVYAQARLAAAVTGRVGRREAAYAERAAELLVAALQRVKAEQRATFWRTRVQREDALAEVRGHRKVVARATGHFER
jgi:tetratricopeptide (TPR) repeat protein